VGFRGVPLPITPQHLRGAFRTITVIVIFDLDPSTKNLNCQAIDCSNQLIEYLFSMSDRKAGQYRRVVSGFDAEGKSVISDDRVIDCVAMDEAKTHFLSTVWTTAESPADVLEPIDGATRKLPGRGIHSPGGTLVRFHEFQSHGGPTYHSNLR
jgi:hypothetical protein